MIKHFFTVLILATCGVVAANAGTVITLDNPGQTGATGTTLRYFGTISNTDPSNTVYLNSDSLTLTAPAGAFSFTDQFFTAVPLSLAPFTNSGDIELFDITVSNPFTDPFTVYSGTYELLGGGDGGAQDLLATASFSATPQELSGTHEPVTPVLMISGLAALGFMRRRANPVPPAQ